MLVFKEQDMRTKSIWFILFATFVSVQPILGGQVLRKTIQAKVRESNLIVIAQVENVWSGKMLGKERQLWHSICSIHQVLKGKVLEGKIVVDFLLLAEDIQTSMPEADKLLKGKKYILFLKESVNSYRLITMHHGVLELSSGYVVFDEDLKDNTEALGKSSSSINGVPSVWLSHDELLQKIKAVVEVEGEKLSSQQSNNVESDKNCKIAFFSNRDRVRDVYVINWDGSEEKNLTSNPKADYFSSWSPDGKKILFMSARHEKHEIYVMNADGSERVNLTNHPANDESPSWSPDGDKISFKSDRDGKTEIYVMDANGSNQINLTNNPSSDWGAQWSPNGKKLAFMSARDGNHEIYVMNADGSGQKNLTNNPAYDMGTSWSPDGSKIAFISDRDGNKEIYVVDSNGSEQKRLTDNPDDDLFGSWSPDGNKIAFEVAIGVKWGQIDIYVMNADGSEKKRLTNNLVKDTNPCWSPDGKKIAFASKRTGNFQIYIMNIDGSNQKRLTHHSGYDLGPVWSPLHSSATKEQ